MPAGPKAIDLFFPSKGVHGGVPREQQPELTVPPDNIMNMVPYDRSGRPRGAVRSGTSKLFAAVMGGGAQAVQQLLQTTIALDPNTVQAGTAILDEEFTYANQALSAVNSGNTWATFGGSIPAINGVANTKWQVISNQASTGADSASVAAGAMYKPALSLGSAYIVKTTFTWDQDTASTDNSFIGIYFRASALATNQFCYFYIRSITGTGKFKARISSNSAGSETVLGEQLTVPALLKNVAHTLEIRVNGNQMQGFIDGIMYVTATSATFSGNSGVGFWALSGAGLTIGYVADSFIVSAGVPLASYRQTNLVSICGGQFYVGNATGTPTNALAGNQSGAILSTVVTPQMAETAGNVFAVDGQSIQQLNVVQQQVVTYTATAGTAPTDCVLACMWRDRLVLAASRANPQNFFFSRVGTPTDWDYSQIDSAAAFAGNASTAGHIGDPIQAVIPFTDDQLLIAGDHNLWMVRGDPADGGSIDLVSDAIGIVGPNAWCKAPDGTVYFVGTGGLFKFAPGSQQPALISQLSDNEFYSAINRTTNYTVLSYDRDRKGLYIFVTPTTSATTTHRLWDERANGFFPIQFPNAHGPVCTLVYDGDGPADRALLLGGRDGYLRKLDPSALNDDGTAISAFVEIGPVKPIGDLTEAKLTHVDVILSESPPGIVNGNWNAALTVQSGHAAYETMNVPRLSASRTYTTPGRQTRWMLRQRGVDFAFRIATSTLNTYFCVEKMIAYFLPGGRERR